MYQFVLLCDFEYRSVINKEILSSFVNIKYSNNEESNIRITLSVECSGF